MMFLLGGSNFSVPDEVSPGLELRVDSGWSIAHLKDTGGDVPYDAWRRSGLLEGWNASIEFLKAICTPTKTTRKEFPGLSDAEIIAACLNRAKVTEYTYDDKGAIAGVKQIGDAQAIWNYYSEKKTGMKPNASDSESSTEPVAESTSN